MNINKEAIPYSKTGYFGKLVIDYITGKDSLKPFYKYPVSIESFKQVIQDKQKQTIDRELLVNVLKEQYSSYTGNDFEKTKANIELLKSKDTFSVTTAHQPNLFLGPLYIIYKTVSSINLAEQLKKQYPSNNFVPVFWMGSEDHDFAELNHVHLFNKTLTWNDETTGAFGRRGTTALTPLLEELKSILGESEQATVLTGMLESAYKTEPTISSATQKMLYLLFSAYGLVVIDGDNADLKRKYIPVMKEELFQRRSFQLLEVTNKELEKSYNVQAKPREINLFYLKDNIRSRIVKEGESWKVLSSNYSFSAAQLEEELNKFPERFSPNVILRALYQEFTLPSVAVIGGGSEVAYLMEMKGLFEYFKVNYPLVLLRNSVLWIDGNSYKKWQNTGFNLSRFFKQADKLANEYVLQQSSSTIRAINEKQKAEQLFNDLKAKAEQLDKSILPMIEGESVRFKKFLETFEDKLLKAEKRKHDTAIQQLRSVKEKLFPENSLQERYDNFIPFYLKYGQDYIASLLKNLNPLEQDFSILFES